MTRLLFIFPASTLAPNYSGGASRHAQNYEALRALCGELHVVRVYAKGTLESVRDFEIASPPARAAIASSTSWQDLEYAPAFRRGNRLDILKRSIVDPVDFEFRDARIIAPIVAEAMTKVQPELIWVEGTDLAAAVSKVEPPIPWVLSHHDLMHRARRIRKGVQRIRDRWLLAVCRRAEQKVSRGATCVVTGSLTEGRRLEALGCRSVHVVPVAYEALPSLPLEVRASHDMRIVHLGSLETTANRIGLEAYLRKAHADVMAACRKKGVEPQFWVIGDNSRTKEPLLGLLHRSNAVLKGFIPDLSSVLRPCDLSILPYEHDTGYRTKLPLLLSYAQVVISTRAAVAGIQLEGLRDVCVLLDQLQEFPSVIAHLASNPAERERLGRAARAFCEQHFTLGAVRAHYRTILESALACWKSEDHRHLIGPKSSGAAEWGARVWRRTARGRCR